MYQCGALIIRFKPGKILISSEVFNGLIHTKFMFNNQLSEYQ